MSFNFPGGLDARGEASSTTDTMDNPDGDLHRAKVVPGDIDTAKKGGIYILILSSVIVYR